MALRLEAAHRGGDQVLVARDVRIAVGGRTLIHAFDGRITRGEVVGLVGPNGAGKSTLLEAIAGRRAVDAGTLRVGESIRLAYYRQDMTQVPTDRSLFDLIHDLRPLWDRGEVQSHLGRFGFSGDEVRRQADTLSGGERARVALALLVLARANFLLLLPLAFGWLVRARGWRTATAAVALASGAAAALSLPFYLYDPAGFTPL